MRGLISIFFGLLFCLGTAAFGQVYQVQYVCNVAGQQGLLRAQLEVVGSTGMVSGLNGDFSVIGGQGYNVWVTGNLRTSSDYFTFAGENYFADFINQNTNGRFLVEWVPQPGALTVVVDPYGAATPYYAQQG
jgi:hypothetical protein